MRRLLAAFVLTLALVASARADSLPELFTRGNAAFARGDHAEAVRAYAALVEAGVDDPDVAYNLASAYGALGQYGQAIRYFERSLRLAPRDDEARAGLQRARDALGERQAQARGEAIVVDRPPMTEALFAWLTADALAGALLLTTWLAVGLWLVLRRMKALAAGDARTEAISLGLGIAAALAATLALVSAIGLGAKVDWGRAGERAVVLHESSAMREGPDDRARLVGELAEGEQVRLLGREGMFARIVARGRQTGYVRGDSVGEI
jgi:tetratricopeptide (TPR) repeat protein